MKHEALALPAGKSHRGLREFKLRSPYSAEPPRYWGQRSTTSPSLYKQRKFCPGAEREGLASRSPAPEAQQMKRLHFWF